MNWPNRSLWKQRHHNSTLHICIKFAVKEPCVHVKVPRFVTDLRIHPKHPEDHPLESATANCRPCTTTAAL